MYKVFIKRFLDILFSITLLPFLFLMLIIISPLIYFEDRGSIFYTSKRRGIYGKTFNMYKFRSMKMNAPDIRNNDYSTFNSDNDDRVTKVGKIIRKLSIDEIPQIINIIKGDMSWIGPRPDMSTRDYSDLNELEKERITVRPGLTGYTQAYYRNSISKDEKYKYDVYYINHLNFLMDVKILFKTFITVVKRSNINYD